MPLDSSHGDEPRAHRAPEHATSRRFVSVMRLVSAAPLAIGALHMFLGVDADAMLGASITEELRADPVLDSQSRFYGAVFMGYGAALYVSLGDLARHAATFRVIGGFIVLGGLARLLSAALRGLPQPQLAALIAIELGLVPLLLLWHARVLSGLGRHP